MNICDTIQSPTVPLAAFLSALRAERTKLLTLGDPLSICLAFARDEEIVAESHSRMALALLSHDMFEGLFAKTALATDIELFDDFPSRYHVHAKRQHRWAHRQQARPVWDGPSSLVLRRQRMPAVPFRGRTVNH